MLNSSLRVQRRRARAGKPKEPANAHLPPTLAEMLARLDGERDGLAGLPDYNIEAKRLEAMLAAAGCAIVPMPVSLMDHQPRLTPAQIGTAQALLRWSDERLAKATGMSATAVRTAASGSMRTRDSTLLKIRTALEAEGIVFLFGADGSAGLAVERQHNGAGHMASRAASAPDVAPGPPSRE